MTDTARAANVHRRAFVADLIAGCPEVLVVTGLGSASYDVFAAGDRPHNFYLWGAMGGAAMVGLGLALAQPQRSVVVITGDGEQLMGIGALSTIGVQRPPNLSIVVLDNGHFGETGMQRSHSSLGTSLSAVARACGIEQVIEIDRSERIDALIAMIGARTGSTLAQVHVVAEELPRALPPRDGVYVMQRFRNALGFVPN